ncbi:peptidoglycan n-acetylglucosamine deacetylase [hydrocarbon metagenome]|uniref:Peptidoglycan n-acetylglucosamine deacetylase n=1 Tax=hydrocarbon metagenome TaxID=938273 RepID=A0A0W8E4Z3_9ZZZZ
MFLVMRRKTAGMFLAGICFFGLSLGAYNFAVHPNTHNWEKQKLLFRAVKTNQKAVALTFDDGPDRVNTPALLEVLDKHDAKATFFVIGSKAEKQPELLKKMAQAGHEIGNHSYDHAQFNGKSDDFILEEIRKANDIISDLTGQTPKFFRPPGGYLSYSMVELARQEKLTIGYWTWKQDSKDWRNGKTPEEIAGHINNNIKPGQIIILHDGSSNGMQTVEAMSILIPELYKQGYRLVTLSELVELEIGIMPAIRK